MSHTVTIKLEIRDVDAFERACVSLGLTFLRGATRCQWEPGANRKCAHAVQFGGISNYQLGLQQNSDGSYSLIQAAYVPNELRNAIGNEAVKLQDAYSAQVAIAQLQSEGYSVNSWVNELGETIVEAIQ